MTREFPDRVATVGGALTQAAGSYLHSVTEGQWTACEVCALPVDGYRTCPQCYNHRRSGLPLADRAGFLVYADEPASQTYRVMRGYKEVRTQGEFVPVVRALLAVGLRGHFECASRLAGTDDYGWAVVPSTKGRGIFSNLVRGLTTDPATEISVELTGAAPNRELSGRPWTVRGDSGMPAHVVVIDDAWVTGASSQSLAVALKHAGVREVSILAVARVLSPHWGPNRAFRRDVLPTLAYDWRTCPWTRVACP